MNGTQPIKNLMLQTIGNFCKFYLSVKLKNKDP